MVEPASSWFAGSVLKEYSSTNWFKFSATSMDAPAQEGEEYHYSRSASASGLAEPLDNIRVQCRLGMTWNRSYENHDNTAVQFDAGYFPETFDINFRYKRLGDNFNPQAMGYFRGNGEEVWSLYSNKSIEVNSRTIDNIWLGLSSWIAGDMEGRSSGNGVNLWAGLNTPGRFNVNGWFDYEDISFDRYEGPEGRWYPSGFSGGINLSSDYRKPLAGWLSFNRNTYLDSYTNGFYLGFRIKPAPEVLLNIEPSLRIQDPATRYSWGSGEWELTDSDWRSLTVAATFFINSAMRIRLNSQASRFERNWQTVENSSVSKNIWANMLYSWEYAPGSWFHFLAGEVQYEEEDPVFTVYAKLMRFF